MRARQLDRVERLGQRADLVDLDEDRVADALLRSPLETARRSSRTGRRRRAGRGSPSRSVSVRQASHSSSARRILDRDDRIALARGSPRARSSRPARSVAALAGSGRRPSAPELGRGEIERDRDPVAMACPLGRLEDRLDRLPRSPRRSGAKPPSSPTAVASPRSCRSALRRVEDLGADPQRLGEGSAPAGNDHELLEVERVLGVRAAVDDVHQRDGQDVRVFAADPAVERDAGVRRGGLGGGERAAEDGVRAEAALVLRPVELDQQLVERPLVGRRRGRASAAAISPLTFSTACGRPCRDTSGSPSRSSTASNRPVDAPDGTAARPRRPTRARRRPRPSGCRASRGSARPWTDRDRGSPSLLLLRAVEVPLLLRERQARQLRPVRRRRARSAASTRADEPSGGGAKRELRVHVQSPRDVHGRRRARRRPRSQRADPARSRARARTPAARAQLRDLLARSAERARERPDTRTRSSPRAAAPSSRRGAPGDSRVRRGRCPRRPSCSVFSSSQRALTSPGESSAPGVPKTCGWRRTSFSWMRRGDRGEVAGAALLEQQREEDGLEEQVAELVERASRRRRPEPRPRPRRPPRRCAARSCRLSARDPRGSRGGAARPAPGDRAERVSPSSVPRGRCGLAGSRLGVVSVPVARRAGGAKPTAYDDLARVLRPGLLHPGRPWPRSASAAGAAAERIVDFASRVSSAVGLDVPERLDHVPAELGLDRLRDLARLECEGGLVERRARSRPCRP